MSALRRQSGGLEVAHLPGTASLTLQVAKELSDPESSLARGEEDSPEHPPRLDSGATIHPVHLLANRHGFFLISPRRLSSGNFPPYPCHGPIRAARARVLSQPYASCRVRARGLLELIRRRNWTTRQPGGFEGCVPIRESQPANEAAVPHSPHAQGLPSRLHAAVFATAAQGEGGEHPILSGVDQLVDLDMNVVELAPERLGDPSERLRAPLDTRKVWDKGPGRNELELRWSIRKLYRTLDVASVLGVTIRRTSQRSPPTSPTPQARRLRAPPWG